jgi:hypothetical protein
MDSSHLDPRRFMREFRRNYTNLYKLWVKGGRSAPVGARIHTPTEHPIHEAAVPDAIKTALADYRATHPGRIEFVKHMRTVNGSPTLVVEDETDLPSEDQLITVSQTVTLNAADSMQVVTDLYVARRA